MRFKIHSQPAGGVRVIEEIADYSLCWLEGHNGVGKTLAIHLLELATGSQPYTGNDAAWRSLRQNLNPVNIEVTDLKDGDQLDIMLTPATWPDTPDPTLDPNLLGSARVNGEEIDMGAVSTLLRVFRVAGDDTITSRFRNMINEDLLLVRRRNLHMREPIEQLEKLTDQLFKDIGDLSSQNLDELEKSLAEIERRREEAAEQLQHAIRLVDDLRELRNLDRTIEQLKVEEPRVEEELHSINLDIEQLNTKRTTLEWRQRELLPRAEQRENTLEQIKNLSLQRENHAEQARAALAQAVQVLEPLGLSPSEEERIKSEAETARLKRSSLLKDMDTLTVSPDLSLLVRNIREPLEEATGTSLDNEIVVTLDTIRLSVESLRDGITNRERELSANLQKSLVEDMEARLNEIDTYLGDVQAARKYIRTYKYQSTRVKNVGEEIRSLSDSLEDDTGEEYKDVVRELEELSEQLIKRVEQRVELRQRLKQLQSGGTREDLERRLAELQQTLDVSAHTQQAREQKAEADLAACRTRLETITEESKNAQAELSTFNQRVTRVSRLFESDPGYSWLRNSLGTEHVPRAGQPTQDCLRRISRIGEAVYSLENSISELTREVAAVDNALVELDENIGKSSTPSNRYVRPLAVFYEQELGDLLRDPDIRHALFEGGRFTGLELLRGEVSWRDKGDNPRRRPIEAFSSGERAFAYVLASVLQRARKDAKNRVLALDEFGAFIESDRLDRLLRFLNERVLKAELADQIIIILPLRQPTIEGQRHDSGSRQQIVSKSGYFMTEGSKNV